MMNQYSPLRILFYPIVLTMLFGGIYFIYKKNPALMDQLSLIEKQKTSGKADDFLMATFSDAPDSKGWSASSMVDQDQGRTGAYPDSWRIRYRFEKLDQTISFPTERNASFAIDDQGVVVQTEGKLNVYDSSSNLIWSLQPNDATLCIGRPAVSTEAVYICLSNGQVAAFYRSTGKVAWVHHTALKLEKMPLMSPKGLILTYSSTGKETKESSWSMLLMELTTGKIVKKVEKLTGPVVGDLAFSKDGQIFSFATSTGQLYVRSLESGESLWKNDFPTGFGAGPTISGDRLYIISEDGVVFCYELRSGKEVWEYTLNQPTHSSLTLFPGLQQGAVLDDKGYLHLMDLKEGKRKWRFGTSTNAKTQQYTAIRLTSESLNKLSLTADGKGWTLWGPCKENQVCAFDPVKGILFRRLELPGPLLAPPSFVNDGNELWVVAQSGKNVEVIKYIEESYRKQIEEKAQEAVDNVPQEN